MSTVHAIDVPGPTELPRLVEVWEAAVRATHDFLEEADIVRFRATLPEALGRMRLACVRGEDGRVLGFVATGDGNIDMLFVDPAVHGAGIGRALVEHAARAEGATTVDVNEQNPRALGFYLRLGFVVERRSDHDSMGNPFPLLHLRRGAR